jgi:glycosyltransferase involved in cell wall biosynthesis
MSNISIIIPTKNESIHIERAVQSALQLTPNVFIVDSYSTDGTIELAEKLGAKVFQYAWTESSNFSKKINWAIQNLPIQTDWVIRLDADEYFMDNCIANLETQLAKVPENVNGITLIRRLHFMGKWMKHSGEYPKFSMRILRVGKATMEDRWLDEHIDIKNGSYINFPYDIVDDPKRSIADWINKHNTYSTKEAIELIHQEINLFKRANFNLDKEAIKKKKQKNIYTKLPKYWRAFFFFLYRYFIKLGFLDGKEGFLWNFLQCWWYRTLADVKVEEIIMHSGYNQENIINFIKNEYSIDLSIKV